MYIDKAQVDTEEYLNENYQNYEVLERSAPGGSMEDDTCYVFNLFKVLSIILAALITDPCILIGYSIINTIF